MKKIYAILVAALMSVSLFAAPSQADLQSYMEDGFYVVCFQAPAAATCRDIYWMGTYADWNIDADLADLVKCEELTGANAGWYVAKVPVVAGKGNNGKPIQLNECGKLAWAYQCGDPDAFEVLAGSVDIKGENGTESALENWSATEPNIVTIAYWKEHVNPCELICAQQSYTFRLYDPYCEWLPEIVPTIQGEFTNWGSHVAVMYWNESLNCWEFVTEPISESGLNAFKFNNDPAGGWDHQFLHYDAENDNWSTFGNLSLADAGVWFTREGNVLTFEWDDPELYQYQGCEEPLPPVYVNASVTLTAPAGAPSAGVELVGGFGEGTWDNGILMTLVEGQYTASVENININDDNKCAFKFRQAASWANQIQIKINEDPEEWKDLDNFSFKDFDLVEGNITVFLDLSDPLMYKWTIPEGEGIENITLTEKAQKVAVDGVLYIIRDNKMFNAQGIQVR